MWHALKVAGVILGLLFLVLGALTAYAAWALDKLLRGLFPESYD